MSNRRFAFLVIVIAFLGAGGLVAVLLKKGARDFDLSSKPPAEVFQKVFKIAPPAGVKNLRVAGWAALSGEVMMRFEADDVDGVIAALKGNEWAPLYGPSEAVQAEMYVDQSLRSPVRKKIDWPEKSLLMSLPVYGFPEHRGDSGWAGVVLVDKERREFFVVGVLY
jgi:hypothetical protein